MIRKNLSSCCAAFVLLCGQSLAADADIKKSPNIIFILIDDMPYTSMSLTGNPELETPNMDRLAKQGMFFTRAYTENLCYPSRTSFLTGQYAARHGRTDVVPGVHPYALMKEPLLPLQPGVDLSVHIDYIHSSFSPVLCAT